MNEIKDFFERGKKALENSEKVIDIDLPTCANRIYIAGENLAFSLLICLNGSSSRDHGKIWNAVKDLFDKGIIKTNYKTLLENSYRLRIKGDYGKDTGDAIILISRDILISQIKELKEFLKETEEILKSKGVL